MLCGGILGAIIKRHEPQLLQDVDWARDPFFRETLSGYTSVMAIPVAGDRLPMTWAIGLKRPPKQFTVSDLEETVERAALVGALLESQILAGELARATSRLTVTRGRWANSNGRCSRHLFHGSPEWRSRRVTSHWAARAAISTTSFLSTKAGTVEPIPTQPRAVGASSSATSRDTAWPPRWSWQSYRPCSTHIPPAWPGPQAY